MKVQEIREKSKDELQAEILRLQREHFSLRMQKASGQLGQTHLLKEVRRDIARVKTVMKETQDVWCCRGKSEQPARRIRRRGQ